jgi:hypothetical protein
MKAKELEFVLKITDILADIITNSGLKLKNEERKTMLLSIREAIVDLENEIKS